MISFIVKSAVTVMLTLAFYSQAFALMDTAKITIRVVDESGNPVENANVGIGFGENSRRHEIPVDGYSMADGTFSAAESCNGYIGFTVTKKGYYESIGRYLFMNKSLIRWEPWNPEITVVLRKIEKPVPMYARDTRQSQIDVPVVGKDIGFDLMLFDWLPPYGKGQVADFYCNLAISRRGTRDFEYRLNITFPRQFDGIQNVEEDLMQGSEFKLPRFAPENGYDKEVKVFVDKKPQGASSSSYKENKSYIFRVRSEVENGKLKKALYGKIIGDIRLGLKEQGTAKLYFKYYLNPDYTRNLEFDPKRNLFLNLPDYERVRIK